MKKSKLLICALFLCLSMSTLVGCACGRTETNNADETPGTTNTTDETPGTTTDSTTSDNHAENNMNGTATDNAANDTGNVVEDAGNAVGDAMDEAGNVVDDIANGAGDVVEDVTDGVDNAVSEGETTKTDVNP